MTTKHPTWTRNRMALTLGAAGLLVLSAAIVLGAQATSRPGFCRAACHEMQPYEQAWSTGPHSGVTCVDCHVDPGLVAQLSHKVVALGEVRAHFAGDVSFPLSTPPSIPDQRCLRCHDLEAIKVQGMDHTAHAATGPCASCHSDAGHEVPAAALQEAGIYNDATFQARRTLASVGAGRADLPRHIAVSCSRCHDMAQTPCSTCHKPEHPDDGVKRPGACSRCHTPGTSFVFAHPQGQSGCGECHSAPEGEHPSGQKCGSCHTKPGITWEFEHSSAPADCTSCHARPAAHRQGSCTTCHKRGTWAFSHPSPSASCTQCHSRPTGHRSGACVTCHRKTGVSWTFTHPTSAKCTTCHARPSGHRKGSCTSCHRPGNSWKFRHPGRSATCTKCHTRPSKHSRGSCSSCHKTSSWKFAHPSSRSCASCHNAPAGHYGSSCASCHRPSRSWSNATFSHPRVPGGEHSYRSFACSKCHPNGYSSYNCRNCHDSADGPSEDDD